MDEYASGSCNIKYEGAMCSICSDGYSKYLG